jgi:hypothetical protein
VNPMECFDSFPKPIARVPRWLKEAFADMYKPGQDAAMHSVVPALNQKLIRHLCGLEKAGKLCLKAGGDSGAPAKVAASEVQFPKRKSAWSNGT